MWSGEQLSKIQATTRPDYLWPEIWSGMSKAAQKMEEQEWAVEEPKQIKLRTAMQRWGAGRMICQNGWRNSLKTLWTTKLQHQASGEWKVS